MNNDVKKNPTWTWDELLLALDVYFELDPSQMIVREAKVIALSNFLNELPIHDDRPQNIKFRNPTGVSMKLRNFLRFDQNYQGRGLMRGGRLEEVIWREFAHDRPRLHKTAQAIRETFCELNGSQQTALVDDDLEEERTEGKILFRVHRLRERNKDLVRKKKEMVLQQTEKLTCEVCGFDFSTRYGQLGRGFAECHHIVPLSSLSYSGVTSIKDLAITCANCHRMFHRSPVWLSVAALQRQLSTSS